MARSPKPKTAPAVQPNAGVEAWYRQRLQKLVAEMASSMLTTLRAAWRDGDMAMDGAHHTNAAGVMFRCHGLVLLVHRTDGKGWAWPAGGIEPGESPEGAARREASEETGWAGGDPLQLVEVREGHGVRFWTYAADVPAAFSCFMNSEHDEYRWVSPQYALRMMLLHPGVRSTLTFLEGMVQLHAADAKPTGPELLRRAMDRWGAMWRRRMDGLSLDLSRKFADKNYSATQAAMKASFAKAGFTVKFRPTRGAVAAFQATVGENVGLIKSIPERFLTDVQAQVWQSVMKGGDMATLSKAVQEKYGVAYRRAALIARDQNNKAKATIENQRRKELGITEAIWQHSHAGKEPRPTHVAMEGKRYKLDKGMYDSAVHKHILPGEEINCRCTSRAVLAGFGE